MDFLKSCIVSGFKAIVGIFLILVIATIFSGHEKEKMTVGYLNSGAKFKYNDDWYQSKRKLKVKIFWDDEIVTASGKKLTLIQFLEGGYKGDYATTSKEYLSN